VISGFLNLDKPQGWTSHDCVAKVRRLLRQKKVGHGGTLDPAASGVLPIALGRATRLLQFLAANKAYRAVIRFGVTTTTDDLEGDVITTQAATTLTEAIAIAPLAQFVGTIDQVPPPL
jgi:tRNA pseudouridine55 synthase